MDKKTRFNTAYNYLRDRGLIHTQKDLADRMNATRPNISNAMAGSEKHLTDNFLKRFNDTFNNIFSYQWLINGDGEMLANEQIGITDLREEDLPHTIALPDGLQLVPVMSEEVAAGVGSENMSSLAQRSSEVVAVPLSSFGKLDFGMRVTGNSMEPTYRPGDILLCSKISERSFIQWGAAYVVGTDNGMLCKRVYESEKKPEALTLVSDNKAFKPFDVEKGQIYGFALVKGFLRLGQYL